MKEIGRASGMGLEVTMVLHGQMVKPTCSHKGQEHLRIISCYPQTPVRAVYRLGKGVTNLLFDRVCIRPIKRRVQIFFCMPFITFIIFYLKGCWTDSTY